MLNVHKFAMEYEFRGDGGDYTPTDAERVLLEDFGTSLLTALTAAEQAEPAPAARSGAVKVKRPERVQAAFEVFKGREDTGPNATALFEYIEQLEAALEPSEPAAKCCNCGAAVDTREVSEGGDYHGTQLEGDQWVCSPECWDAKTEPAPAAEPYPDTYSSLQAVTVHYRETHSHHPSPSEARLREALEDIKAIGQIAVGNATINRMVSIAAAALKEASE